MKHIEPLREPWLVTAWPGPGGVALAAAGHLIDTLRATLAWNVDPTPYFPLEEVRVREGMLQPARRPRASFFVWRSPAGPRDLVVFLAEAVPMRNTRRLCAEIIDAAARLQVRRIIPFASVGTRMHPAETPRVFGAADSSEALREMLRAGADSPDDGSIEGINGGLLAMAAARDVPSSCLTVELPLFAMNLPNPCSARALLNVFAALADIRLDSSRLDAHVALMEQPMRDMIDLVERLRGLTGVDPITDPEPQGPETEEGLGGDEAHQSGPAAPGRTPLTAAMRRRIEALFEAARSDLAKASALKLELDRNGVFSRFEDRFLDLFRS